MRPPSAPAGDRAGLRARRGCAGVNAAKGGHMPAGRPDRAGNHRGRKPAGHRRPAGREFLRSNTPHGTNVYSRAAYSETSSRDFYHMTDDPSMGPARVGSWSIIQPRERIRMERSEAQAAHDRHPLISAASGQHLPARAACVLRDHPAGLARLLYLFDVRCPIRLPPDRAKLRLRWIGAAGARPA